MEKSKKPFIYFLLAIIILSLPRLAKLYTDFLWFDTQALSSVYFTTLSYQLSMFVIATTITFLALWGTLVWTEKNLRKHKKSYERTGYILPIIGTVTLFFALSVSAQWEVALRFFNSYLFGTLDPHFAHDISLYVYGLPFYDVIIGFVTVLASLCIVLVLTLFALHSKKKIVVSQEEDLIQTMPRFDIAHYFEQLKKYAYTQLLVLGAVLLITTAVGYWIGRFELLFSTHGAVYGIGFVEQFVRLPAMWILAILCSAGAIAFLINIKLKKNVVVAVVAIAIMGASILSVAASVGVQALIVEPDEINKEHDFIANEIVFTRKGFALDRVSREVLEGEDVLTQEILTRHQPTIENARLWDDRPLLQTLNEIQIFRTYYRFPNIDVARYTIDGERRLMMLATREIDISNVQSQSQTWVNRHLVYTHGFGVVAAPASDVTSANLPRLVAQDIPPTSSVGLDVTQPRIYYGELSQEYAIVNTLTAELDYPSGDENVRINYPGTGGVVLDNGLKRVGYALVFGSTQILFSDSITAESRIQYYRSITERARTLAPFLTYDNDPYIVIRENGELYWILDAYTTTNKYPYSNPVRFNGKNTNYVRNSVKVTVNAFDGTTRFFVTEPQDPLINTYRAAYPDLFSDFEDMPKDLRAHVRYPQDLFSTQTQRYRDYHMQDPSVFYNREDSWRIPNEVVRGVEQTLQPYYQIMQLPGFEEAEFVQVQPFIPRGRENLIGWMAARSDGDHYGELRAYHFSKQELTFGPMQIESRIDQDTDISQQITLWSRAGSGVVRGNLLVIPIENTILYVEPLFLEAREQGSLPQLMRIIVVHGDRVAMASTLEIALQAVLDPDAVDTPIVQDPDAPVVVDQARIQEIREAYHAARDALERGDFAEYAQRIEALEALLE